MHVIIPAGGAGTRLWPLSRKDKPKFLRDLNGLGRTLIQQTVDRLAGLAEAITVVTGEAHAGEVKNQVPQARILVEPSARGTMGAIGLAAALVERENPDEIIGSFAADHLIADTSAFHRAVSCAMEAAEKNFVATIGITPDEPSTAYGYIKVGAEIDAEKGSAYTVESFVEKPNASRAAEYLSSGNYLWNAGMFVAKAGVLMGALERFHPSLAHALRALASRWEEDRQAAIEQLWNPMESAVIDTAIAEPLADEGGVAVVPAQMGWSDVGDYASLAEVISPGVRNKQVVPGGTPQRVVTMDSPDSLVYAGNKTIVVSGIPGAVVVDMDDVLFITTVAKAQEVKKVVDNLENEGLGFLK